MTTGTVFCMAVAYSVTGLDARSTPSCRFTSERRGLPSHLALIRFVQLPLCLRFVSRLSPATDSDKLTKAHEAKKKMLVVLCLGACLVSVKQPGSEPKFPERQWPPSPFYLALWAIVSVFLVPWSAGFLE